MSDERMREIELPSGVCSLTLIKSRQYQSHPFAIGRRRSRRPPALIKLICRWARPKKRENFAFAALSPSHADKVSAIIIIRAPFIAPPDNELNLAPEQKGERKKKSARRWETREGKRRVDKFSTKNSDVSDTYAKYNMSGECSFFTRAHNLAIFLYTRLPEQAASCEKRQVLNIINRRTLHHLAFCIARERASKRGLQGINIYYLAARAHVWIFNFAPLNSNTGVNQLEKS